ncbi:FecCD family ABC transporter permease [Allonocardiopsis opalescens]|uniref:Iron complex transport system permease protein n=1 Tax=Allonocardiopsis opalescens TaxID=1144618 RepID=A0A2T0Q1U0_9ACTN|nr:iron ABC transporter permease [Allonocardiopsis opalescens]PRX97765.1 iron complex transport system permease protein [Allonocardiopsis opalescens]
MRRRVRGPVVAAALAAAAALCALANVLAYGDIPAGVVADVLAGERSGQQAQIMWTLRFPQAATALLVGAALGVAGLVLQLVLRNPLAAPELTGVNPGAVLGLLLALVLGLTDAASAAGALTAALVGGLAGGALTWLLAREHDSAQLVVYGLLCSALLTGLTTMLLAYQPSRFGNALRWLVGSVEGRTWDHLAVAGPWIAVALGCVWLGSAALGVLGAGDDHAAALGLPAARARGVALAGAVALAAGAVALAGAVAFVGLVVPHLARAAAGSDPRFGVPAAAALGAAAVTGADALAQLGSRWLAAEVDGQRLGLPTGVVTAVLGAAALVLVVRRGGRGAAMERTAT